MIDDARGAEEEARQLGRLLARCPANPRVPPEREADLPIDVAHWGEVGSKVLIIHGGEQTIDAIGGGPGNFSAQKILGKQGWQLSVPSRPGLGKSPSRGRDDQIADARWIAAMLREGGSTHLWGHSFGGAEALLATAAAPGSVRSLILIEPDLWPLGEAVPTGRVPDLVHAFRERRRQAILGSDTPEAYASNFLASFQPERGGTKVWLARQALRLMPRLRRTIGCGALQAHEASGAAFLQAIEAVKSADIPVLLVTGGWDAAHDALGAWVADLTGGTHAVVPSADHIIMRSNPNGLNALAVRFMTDAERSRAHPTT